MICRQLIYKGNWYDKGDAKMVISLNLKANRGKTGLLHFAITPDKSESKRSDSNINLHQFHISDFQIWTDQDASSVDSSTDSVWPRADARWYQDLSRIDVVGHCIAVETRYLKHLMHSFMITVIIMCFLKCTFE